MLHFQLDTRACFLSGCSMFGEGSPASATKKGPHKAGLTLRGIKEALP